MDGISYRICLAFFFVHWSSRYSIQPYSSIPFAWKDSNLLVCTQDLMGSFSCSDAWKQLHCWDKHGVSNVLCVLAPNTSKSGGVALVALWVDGKNLNGRNFLQNLSGIFFCPLKFQVFYSTLFQYSFWLEGCKSAPLISFVLNKTWWVLSPTAASPGSSRRSQHFPLQRGTAKTKHGVSNVLSVLAPPNACKSGGVAWVALCLAGLGQIKMKSGRVTNA